MKKLFGITKIKSALILIFLILIGLFFYQIQLNKKRVNINPPISSTNSKTWQFYTSPEGNFKILFPSGNPEIITDKYNSIPSNPDLKYRLLQYDELDTNGDEYWVEVGVYPKEFNLRNGYDNLKRSTISIEENLKNFDNATLISSKQSSFIGVPSMDLQFKSKELNYKYRIFITGDYDYSIAVRSTNNRFPLFEKFANSFQTIRETFPNPPTGFLSGNNSADIKSLQDYINVVQERKKSWQSVYSTGRYSKQDLDKLLDLLSRMISSSETIMNNLQSGKDVADNHALWNAIVKMTTEAGVTIDRLKGQE